MIKKDSKSKCTLGTNISHLGKRKVIFKSALVGDMLVPGRLHFRMKSASFGLFMRSISKEKGNLLWLSPPRPQQQWQQQKNQGHKQRQQEEKEEKEQEEEEKKTMKHHDKQKTTRVQTKKKCPTYPGITQLESIVHNQDTRLWVSKNLGQIGVGSPPEPPRDKNRG